MKDPRRRDVIQSAAVAAGRCPDPAAPTPRRTPMTYELKKSPFDPSRIKGMSGKLPVSRYENNHTGAVKRLDAPGRFPKRPLLRSGVSAL